MIQLFFAETCVFVYLGLALFSFPLIVKPSFIIWTIILCLVGRAANIYPLSYLCNYFREHKISPKMMFIMWFSGLRGAIAYALSLHLEFEEEKKRVVVTTTLVIVLFTLILMGGSTMPLMKYLKADKSSGRKSKRKRKTQITLSKTKEMVLFITNSLYLFTFFHVTRAKQSKRNIFLNLQKKSIARIPTFSI